jgi:GT2 family glycosyltransferase
MTRIAVVVPHYQQAQYLEACVQSLLAQTRVPDEIVVVDSSPSQTEAVLARVGDRVRHLVKPPNGVAAARNAGIAATTCELISLLDADNMATPDRIERQLQAFESHPEIVLCHGAIVPVDRAGSGYAGLPRYASEQVPFERQLGWLLDRNRVATDSVCVRREALNRLGGFCEADGVREDYDLWLRLASAGPFRYVDEPLAVYRRHEANLSNDEAYMFEWEAGALRRVEWPAIEEALRQAFPDETERAVVEAEVHLRRGEVDHAEILFVALARRRPPVAAALFHLSHLSIDRGLLVQAEGMLRRVLAQDPGDAAAWNNLGGLLVRSGKHEQGADAFARAVSLRPHYEDAVENFRRVHRDVAGPWRVTRRRLRSELLPLAPVAATAYGAGVRGAA